MSEQLKNSVFRTDGHNREVIIRMPGAFLNSEDILSIIDFVHLLKPRGIPSKFRLSKREGTSKEFSSEQIPLKCKNREDKSFRF